MLLRIMIGAALGVLVGGLVGYIAKARGGTCPLTCNPSGGALFGAVIGAALALALSGGGSATSYGSGQEFVHHVQTEQQFEQKVLGSPRPVLVDFYTPTCGYCKILAPVFGKLAAEYAGKADFVSVNAAEAVEIARTHGISGVPTVILFHQGREQRRWTGALEAGVYRSGLEPFLEQHPPTQAEEG